MRRLSVRMGRLSPRFCAWLVPAAVIVVSASGALGYTHHTSKVRFVEHSPAVFEAARREGKPVFLLIGAVWCYWCKYFDQQVLQDAEVARYLNRHYVSVFADHDRRPDLVFRYVRGLPTVVLFGADGRVRQSFARVLKKEDFLGVVRNVATSPLPATGPRPVATAAAVPVTPDGYRRLTGQSQGRKDLRDVALRTLDFMRAKMVGGQGAFHLHEYRTGRRLGDGHLDANAWAALAFLEGYRVVRVEAYRGAGEQVLAIAEIFDAWTGAFGEAKSVPPLDANGVMAEALLHAHRPGGRADYPDVARRVLATLSETVRGVLVENDDAVVRVGDAAHYLRAYARMVASPQGEEQQR